MDECRYKVLRKGWEHPFVAEAAEVGAVRRIVRGHLTRWGLVELVEAAELCASELVTNVVTHVGEGTPATLGLTLNGTLLRIEVGDPDTRALPTLLASDTDAEGGRGIALLDAVADRWGVTPQADSKVTWCELATGLTSPSGHVGGPRIRRAEALVDLYGGNWLSHEGSCSPVSVNLAEEAAIDLIADLLHWFRAHGCDPDDALDRAEMRFESVGDV